MRLIDADRIFPYGSVPYIQDDGFRTADRIYGIIKNAPTVDAVPVVRCKDCWKSAYGLCSYQLKNVPGKDFCGDGERKDNDIH